MSTAVAGPAELVGECLTGGIRRLLGGVHSLTSARVVLVRLDPELVRVMFSFDPGRLGAPWEPDERPGWFCAPRGAQPGLRDSSADPVLVVVGVGEHQVLAVNMLAIDEIGVCCRGRGEVIGNWRLQVAVQGADSDAVSLAGARISENPDATVVVADALVDGPSPGWVDVLGAGSSWPVRPLRSLSGPAGDDESSRHSDEDPDRPAPAAQVGSVSVVDDAAEAASGQCVLDDQHPGERVGGGQMMVFGRFEVSDAEGVALQPMQQQIIGAIALLQPIPTAQLCQLLYGTERQKSFHVAMSKIRRRGLSPVATDDGYRVDVGGDWSRFCELVGDDPAEATTETLRRAAQLVSGPLLGREPPPWAAAVVPLMAERVVEVFRELAARHSEDSGQALDYARRGLAVSPGHPELAEIVSILNAAGTQRDTDEDMRA